MKRWQFWLGLIISAVFLYLVLRKIDYAALWQVLIAANYWWLIPGCGGVFYCPVGALLALALPPASFESYSHPHHVSHRHHGICREQHFSCQGG